MTFYETVKELAQFISRRDMPIIHAFFDNDELIIELVTLYHWRIGLTIDADFAEVGWYIVSGERHGNLCVDGTFPISRIES